MGIMEKKMEMTLVIEVCIGVIPRPLNNPCLPCPLCFTPSLLPGSWAAIGGGRSYLT